MDEPKVLYDSSKEPSLLKQAWEESGGAGIRPGQWLLFAANLGLTIAGIAWVVNRFQGEDHE